MVCLYQSRGRLAERWPIASFRCAAEFGCYRGIAGSDKKRAAELERAAQEGERRIEAAKGAGGDDEAEGLRRQQAFIAGQADMIKALHNDTFGGGKPAEAEIKGNADVNVNVNVNVKLEPTPDFWTRVTTAASNGINSLHINGTAPTGTTGATGRSVPEASPGSP
jgi:hypothetical protein